MFIHVYLFENYKVSVLTSIILSDTNIYIYIYIYIYILKRGNKKQN